MYAVVADVELETEPTAEHLTRLRQDVAAGVKAAPGFVAGYWLAPVDRKGHSVVVFETEDQARAAAPPVGAGPMPGVTIVNVEIREVVASA